MIVLVVLALLVAWWLIRRRHRVLTEHQSHVMAAQPLTEWSARFPRAPQGRVRSRKGRSRGGF